MSFPLIALTPFCAVAANDTRAIRQPSREIISDDYAKLAAIPNGWVTLTGNRAWHDRVLGVLREIEPALWGDAMATLAPEARAWCESLPPRTLARAVREDEPVTRDALVPGVRDVFRESCKAYAILGGNPIRGLCLDWYAGTCELGGRITASIPTGAEESFIVAELERLDAETRRAGVLTLVRETAATFVRVRESLGDDGSLSDRVEMGILELYPDGSCRSRWIPPMAAAELAEALDLRCARPTPDFLAGIA